MTPPFPLIVLDTETTGLPHQDFAHVVEVGAVLLNDEGYEVASFSSLVRPVVDLDERMLPALEVNQIDPRQLLAAPWRDDVWRSFCAWAGLAAGIAASMAGVRRIPVTSYNLVFDRTMMERTFPMAASMPWAEPDRCIMLQCKDRMPKGKKRFRQTDVAARLGIEPFQPVHRAVSDARTAAAIWRAVVAGELDRVVAEEAGEMGGSL